MTKITICSGSITAFIQHAPMPEEDLKITTVADSVFRKKPVTILECIECSLPLTKRGMEAVLLGNTTVTLYSTDVPTINMELVGPVYRTKSCQCGIQDIACKCGNVVGYHVILPCKSCLSSCHNGHMFMYYNHCVVPFHKVTDEGSLLTWRDLPQFTQESRFVPEEEFEQDEER